jgi:hypothetical protein
MLFSDAFPRLRRKRPDHPAWLQFRHGCWPTLPGNQPRKPEGPAQDGPARSGSLRLFDELHRIANSDDGLGGVIGDLDAELFLESHDEFDAVERVGAEIIDEVSILFTRSATSLILSSF